LARWLGAPMALTLGSAVLLVVVLVAWIRVPELRQVR
jgi:hypothetical protein